MHHALPTASTALLATSTSKPKTDVRVSTVDNTCAIVASPAVAAEAVAVDSADAVDAAGGAAASLVEAAASKEVCIVSLVASSSVLPSFELGPGLAWSDDIEIEDERGDEKYWKIYMRQSRRSSSLE